MQGSRRDENTPYEQLNPGDYMKVGPGDVAWVVVTPSNDMTIPGAFVTREEDDRTLTLTRPILHDNKVWYLERGVWREC